MYWKSLLIAGVLLSHSINYSSWMNHSGHGVQLVKTLVPHSAGRWLRQNQRLAFAIMLKNQWRIFGGCQ